VKSREDAEDIAQESFVRVYRYLNRLTPAAKFSTLLFGIARNLLREYVKKKSRRPDDVDFHVTRLEDLGPSPSVILGERKEQALLLAALRAVTLELQIVIELSFFEGMTQREIAEVLDVPPGTVASRIRRGKEALFEKMKEIANSSELLDSTMHGLERWVAVVDHEDPPA
jgi:RNA polymerase sigma factor (sigma-70 family)